MNKKQQDIYVLNTMVDFISSTRDEMLADNNHDAALFLDGKIEGVKYAIRYLSREDNRDGKKET